MNPDGARDEPTPIEDYLDELAVRLRREPPRRARHLLAEAEAHLYDAAGALRASGAGHVEAETEAVARFGPATEIAQAERHAVALPVRAVLGQVGVSGLLLGAIGAVAVGASGVVAGLLQLAAGRGTIVDVHSGPPLTAANCSRWLANGLSAGSCRAAALSDWAFDTVFFRIALGVLGLLALGAFLLLRRTARGRALGLLPGTISDTIGTGAFGAAGVLTLGLGVDAVAVHQASGQWFSAAVVAVPLALVFGIRLLSRLRLHPA